MTERHRNWFKYDVDVAYNAEKPHPAWICATKRDAIAVARREGARMWRGGDGVFKAIRVLVKPHGKSNVVFEWSRRSILTAEAKT